MEKSMKRVHKVVDDSWYRREPGLPHAVSAGGVVVRRKDDRILVALVCEIGRPAYILPKGHVEYDETIEESARREIAEEAGFTELETLGYLGAYERMNFARDCWKTIHYLLFSTDQVRVEALEGKHLYQTEWHPIDDLPEMLWPEQRALIEQNASHIHSLLVRIAV
jgi:8-oxo-dGTP pyrophosphatase MutT (NUDIX family)